MGRKKTVKTPEQPFRFHAREHETGEKPRMRVWVPGWAGDQFEVITYAELRELAHAVNRFSIVIQVHNGSCDGHEPCKCPFFDLDR